MIVLTTFIGLLVFYFFFQGEINQGNLKTYQRTVGRKLFIFYHITLNILLSFLIFFNLFVSILWSISSFPSFFFLTRDLFHTFFFKGSFTLIVDLAFRLPNCLMDLPRNFPEKKFLNWNILLNVIFFYVSQVTFCNWPSSVVVRRPLTVAA